MVGTFKIDAADSARNSVARNTKVYELSEFVFHFGENRGTRAAPTSASPRLAYRKHPPDASDGYLIACCELRCPKYIRTETRVLRSSAIYA
jgi:hypothetical protein